MLNPPRHTVLAPLTPPERYDGRVHAVTTAPTRPRPPCAHARRLRPPRNRTPAPPARTISPGPGRGHQRNAPPGIRSQPAAQPHSNQSTTTHDGRGHPPSSESSSAPRRHNTPAVYTKHAHRSPTHRKHTTPAPSPTAHNPPTSEINRRYPATADRYARHVPTGDLLTRPAPRFAPREHGEHVREQTHNVKTATEINSIAALNCQNAYQYASGRYWD
jgi:hypothetical protein